MTSGTESFEEQFFTCSICTDVFQEPKVLPCQHSFCKNCIKPYIKSAVTTEKDKTGFLCPYCRCFVEAVDTSTPAESWVDKIPTNFNLVCMIEAFDQKRDAGSNTTTKCLLHMRDRDFHCRCHDQTVCASCAITGHRDCSVMSLDDVEHDLESLAICVSRRLTKINTVLGSIGSNINTVKQNKRSLKEETVVVFDKIKTEIDKVRDKFFETADQKCDDVTKDLNVKYEHCRELQIQVQGLFEQLVALKSKSTGEIIKGTKNVKEMINLFESEISKIDDQEVFVELKWTEDVDKIVQNIGVLGIMTVNERRQAYDKDHVMSIPFEPGLKDSSNEEKSMLLDTANIYDSIFKTSDLSSHVGKLNFLSLLGESSGEFSASVTDYDSPVDEPGSPLSGFDNHPASPLESIPNDLPHLERIPNGLPPAISKNCASFGASVENDSRDCLITGITFLPDDQIVLADRNNKKLKLFSEDHTFIRSLNLDFAPFDTCVIDGERIAVSIPEKEMIEFYNSQLTGKTGSVSTEQACYGMATGSGRLFVVCRSAFYKRNSIKVYDGYNELSQTITLEHSSIGNRIVYSPLTCNIFYSNKNLLSASEVVCLTDIFESDSRGKIAYVKKIPRLGKCVFALMPNGIIAGSQKSNLYWISFDGNISEEVLKLDHLEDELSTVTVRGDGCKLLVSQTHNLFNTEETNDVYEYDIVM